MVRVRGIDKKKEKPLFSFVLFLTWNGRKWARSLLFIILARLTLTLVPFYFLSHAFS